MKRRGFLGLLGLSPFGAKMAADDALVQMGFQHGSKVLSAAAPALEFNWPTTNPKECAPTSSSDMGWLAERAQKLRAVISRSGIPKWKLEELRERAWMSSPPGIDPDLTVLQSMSPSRKAIIQRARNFERVKALALTKHTRDLARAAFAKKTGIDWYD